MSVRTPTPVSPLIAAADLRCRIMTDAGALGQLAADWEDLLRRSSADELMLTPLWLLPWWRVYGARHGQRLCAGLFYAQERLVGLALLQARRVWYRPGVPLRRLEPVGADVDEGDGVASEYLNVIAERGREESVAAALVEVLQAGRWGTWDELLLSSMDGAGPMPALLQEACRRAGLGAEVQTTSAAPYVPLPRTWEDYLRQLGKNGRYVARTLRVFAAWAGSTAEFHRARTPHELEEGKRILLALHAERWQGAGRPGVFRAARFARFHDEVMRLALERGILQLEWLTAHGRALAAVYNLCWNHKVYFYQSGRALDVPGQVRPGIVLHAHCLRAAIERGDREYDFLAGASRYKQQLSLASRPIVTLRAWRNSWREQLRRVGERGIDVLRTLRNRLRRPRKDRG